MVNERRVFLFSVLVAILLPLTTIISYPFYHNVDLVVDTGASVYQWMKYDPSIINTIMIIILFGLHLGFNAYYIMQAKKSETKGFSGLNYNLLTGNLIFILLHQLQTNIGYDGLAIITPVWSSQFSVIFMLCMILVMMMPSRGLILNKKIKLSPKRIKFLYQIHGIVFMTALVFTFWFHPMVFTWAHYTGFVYMNLLFIQGCFVNTKIHSNKAWIVVLELSVVVHAVAVAYLVQQSSIWTMFMFGFLFIFFFTQVYAFKFDIKIKYLLTLLYLVLAFIFYFMTDISNIHQILWIPVIEYLIALILIAILKIKE